MNRKRFTQEEITLLWQNPYTLSVNEREINFTPEFKEAFLKLYKDGSTAAEAVTALGYDPDLLGRSRIRNFFKTFSGQKEAAKKRSSPDALKTGSNELNARVKQLEFQVRYMKAELEFLKKKFFLKRSSNVKETIAVLNEFPFKCIHEMVQMDKAQTNVALLCEIAGVSRSGYYAWVKAADKRAAREAQDRQDFELIRQAYASVPNGKGAGARGIYMIMLHWNPIVIMNVKKIRRLMKKYGLKCYIRRKNKQRQIMKAMQSDNYADNVLLRQFEAYGPRKVLLTDITYIPYDDEHDRKFAYLSTILDAYTKEILAYVVSDSLEEDFVLETVKLLAENHRISLNEKTLIHSDQGSHYSCIRFIDLVKSYNLRHSMSRRGNCWDNAPQESFFGHMKDNVDCRKVTDFEQVKEMIDEYMV